MIAESASETKSAAGTGSISPVRILSVIAVLLALFIILAPQERADQTAGYSSYGTGAGGVRALYEVLGRLGFSMSRNERPLTPALATVGTYVLLQPTQPLTTAEQNNLLKAVRNGATLVFTPDDEAFTDSLGFELLPPTGGFPTLSRTHVAGGNPRDTDLSGPQAALRAAFPISVTVAPTPRSGTQAFMWLVPGDDSHAARLDSAHQSTLVSGHRVGRGYAIAVAPPTIVMNQVIREPRAAIAIVRAIQFANSSIGASGTQPHANDVVFDEYHHGFGVHADMPAAVINALTNTPLGRVTLELVAAALVLLLAIAVRPIAPVSIPAVSRRSPLEHVGALAHAYAQVNARALGTGRLVRGLRRRHPLGLPRSLPDSVYLTALRDRIPSAATDVDRILSASTPDLPDIPDRFVTIGAAVANIERTLQT